MKKNYNWRVWDGNNALYFFCYDSAEVASFITGSPIEFLY